MNTEKFLTFSEFSILGIAVGVTTTTHLPTDTTPPNQILEKDSYLDLGNSNKSYFLVCG